MALYCHRDHRRNCCGVHIIKQAGATRNILRALSRYRNGAVIVDCRMNSVRKSQKEHHPIGGVLFGNLNSWHR